MANLQNELNLMKTSKPPSCHCVILDSSLCTNSLNIQYLPAKSWSLKDFGSLVPSHGQKLIFPIDFVPKVSEMNSHTLDTDWHYIKMASPYVEFFVNDFLH